MGGALETEAPEFWQAHMADTLTRAMAYLDRLPVAVSGQGGHNATLRAACECVRFGLSDADAWEALQWFNDYRCQPKWSEHELRHKLADARKIVSGGGQVGQHLGRPRYGNRPARVFVAPAPPRRKVQTVTPFRPVWEVSEAEEEERWAAVAATLGLTLAEFDARCGVELTGASMRPLMEAE